MTADAVDPLLKLLLSTATTFGVTGLLAFIVVAFLRGDIVPGNTHREQMDRLRTENTRLLAERNLAFDELKQIAQLGAAVANAKRR